MRSIKLWGTVAAFSSVQNSEIKHSTVWRTSEVALPNICLKRVLISLWSQERRIWNSKDSERNLHKEKFQKCPTVALKPVWSHSTLGTKEPCTGKCAHRYPQAHLNPPNTAHILSLSCEAPNLFAAEKGISWPSFKNHFQQSDAPHFWSPLMAETSPSAELGAFKTTGLAYFSTPSSISSWDSVNFVTGQDRNQNELRESLISRKIM